MGYRALFTNTVNPRPSGGPAVPSVDPLPPAAVTYYIDQAGSNGNDGLSLASAWKDETNANALSAHPSGRTDILVSPGNWRGFVIQPANSGTDIDHMIRWMPRGGIVTLLGTTATAGEQFAIINDQDFIYIARDPVSGGYFLIDGEADNGKYVSARVEDHGLQSIANLQESDNCIYEFNSTRTAGGEGINFKNFGGGSNIYRILYGIHGNIYSSLTDPSNPGADIGDWFQFRDDHNGIPISLHDGEWADNDETHRHMGHTHIFDKGMHHLRHWRMVNRWGDVAGHNTDDGNRSVVVQRSATECCVEDNLFLRTGYSGQDGVGTPTRSNHGKEGGRENIWRRNLYTETYGNFIQSNPNDTMKHCEDLRIYNNTYWTGYEGIEARQSTGKTWNFSDLYYYNNIFWGITQTQAFHWEFQFPNSGDWFDHVFFHNNVVPIGVQLRARSSNGGTDTGWQTLAWFETNYPTNFANNLQVDPDFVSPQVEPTFAQAYSGFEPQEASLLGAGRHLSTADGAGVSQNQITITDPRFWPIPHPFQPTGWIAPTKGPYAGGHKIFIEGVGLVSYTGLNYNTRVMLLDDNYSWANGAKLGDLSITPDIGMIQT